MVLSGKVDLGAAIIQVCLLHFNVQRKVPSTVMAKGIRMKMRNCTANSPWDCVIGYFKLLSGTALLWCCGDLNFYTQWSVAFNGT